MKRPRSIPPKTMADVSRQEGKRRESGPLKGMTLSLGLGGAGPGARAHPAPPPNDFQVKQFKKPRNWQFQTKPLFKKVRGPLIDVFHEAEEVLIVIDLGGFAKGDVTLTITPERYTISAHNGEHEFREEIPLPPEVDIDRCVEKFRNGVFEIILPKSRDENANEDSHTR